MIFAIRLVGEHAFYYTRIDFGNGDSFDQGMLDQYIKNYTMIDAYGGIECMSDDKRRINCGYIVEYQSLLKL